jgi:hypothetical protein
MHADPHDERPQEGDESLHTPEELFARPECTHIYSMYNPNQTFHIERTVDGFRVTSASPWSDRHHIRDFPSLDEMYREMQFPRMRFNLSDAVWRDISEYPAFPYGVLYLPLSGSVQVDVHRDNEILITHGEHAVYGPASISVDDHSRYVVTPTDGWLVVEYPAYTVRASGMAGIAIIRPTHNAYERMQLRLTNFWLRHRRRPVTWERLGRLNVYGRPPANWREVRQVLAPR